MSYALHRRYSPIGHGRVEGIDYRTDRPFKSWHRPRLETSLEEWIGLDPPRLELATLAYDELKLRGGDRSSRALFDGAEVVPIPWLAKARKRVLRELPPSTNDRLRARVYVVLRGGYTEGNGWYGAYVGQTSKSVEARLLEHRTGVRACRGLEQHGIELLYSLFDWVNPVRASDRFAWETRLHSLLVHEVPKVSGDTA